MKHKRILRIFGLALIFSLLAALIPAIPVFAAYDISISPTQGMVGATITITGTGFSPSTDTSEKYARVYFSPVDANINQNIDLNVATYDIVQETPIGFEGDEDEGEFYGTFTIPSSCVDGATDLAAVAPGTYYIYVTVPTTTIPNPTLIRSKAVITVTPGATLDPLSPATGPAGTDVLITGTNFPASTALVFKFDGAAIAPKSGDTATRSTGIFLTTVTIPAAATAGIHTITVTAGASGDITATFTVTAAASLSPLSPITGAPGTDITITGANFPANTALIFQFGTTAVTPKAGSLMTNASGGFMSIITVPSTATDGGYLITVTAGTTAVTAPFTVAGATTTPPTSTPPTSTPPTSTPPTSTPPTSTPPTTTPPTGIPSTPSANPSTSVQLLSGSGAVGSDITLIGMDFTAGATVVFSYDGVTITSGTANNDGFVSASLKVPAGMHGAHTILANDGQNWDTLEFMVESQSPSTPQPNAPRMGAKIKSPALFDWDDGVDDSLPITYKMQIAADEDFEDIILDIEDIEVSEYTLTDDEFAELDDPEATYYWREKAVDGAMNESPWTGPGEFTVAQPFRFAGWPLYLTISIGAIVFFLLGLWIGRRTAFYY